MDHASREAPASIRIGWSAAMVAAVLAVATVAAIASRGLVGGFGLDAAGAVTVIAATLATGLALLPMAAIIELPRAMWGHWVPERRHRAGRCPACGYGGAGGRCPERGAAFERPPSYAADWATLRRVAWTVAPASLAAAALGLVIAVTDERENFQGRYILNHPFDGEITCPEGKDYVAATRARIKEEAALLRKLTGWSAANIASNIAKTVSRRYR